MEINQINTLILESVRTSVDAIEISRSGYFEPLKATLSSSRPIKVLTGLRRSGKSFLLKQLYWFLRKTIAAENIFFVNFESDLASSLRQLEGLREAFETFAASARTDQPLYVFLDEIQVVDGWHGFVRSLYDAGRCNMYLTGSNAHLLSSEFSSALGGRVIESYIQPFDLQELLLSRAIKFGSDFERAENSLAIQRAFGDMLIYGGIPEVYSVPVEQRLQYRQSLIEKIIINDILGRYQVDYPELLGELLEVLERSASGIVSTASLARASRKSEQTISNYLNYLAATFACQVLGKYNFKTKQALRSQIKYYFADNLLIHRADQSAQLENLVYGSLVRKYGRQSLNFARDERGYEVDFYVRHYPDKEALAVQVCWELNPENMTREVNPLKLMREYSRGDDNRFVIVTRRCKVDRSNLPDYIEIYDAIDFLLNR